MYLSGATYNGGDEVYYNGYIYQARWWTQEVPSPSATNWDLIGACGTGIGVCADFPTYANGRIYNAPNRVSYGGAVYKTYTYIKNKVPPELPWEKVCDCN